MRRFGRYSALPLLGCLASLPLLLACGSSTSNGAPSDAGSVEASFDAGPRIDDTTAQANRTACKYARGAMPAETIGASTPIGPDIPIDHIVVVMMENHSFDSYFGHLNAYAHRTDIESAPPNATNPDGDAGAQPWVHGSHLCTLDTDHTWGGTHTQINGGAMDGFALTNEGTPVPAAPGGGTLPASLGAGGRALWWYDERDLPFYYQLASTFAIADHYHCSVPGPTWPNRRFLYAATSWGGTVTAPPLVLQDEKMYPYPGNNPATILDELEASKTSWMYYSDGLPTPLLLTAQWTNRWHRTTSAKFAAFQDAAKAGTLPSVAFVDPDQGPTSGSENDEHPPGDLQEGQKFVSDVVHAVMASPQWAHTAIFITHDEHGGFYDHVPPPKACAPDSIAPILVNGDTTTGGYDMLGIRVVLIAVSPYSKKGYVGHHTYDHTSITRFIEARFELRALTARDANAEPLTDLFDFKSPPAFKTPPSIPSPTIDPTELSYCTATFGM